MYGCIHACVYVCLQVHASLRVWLTFKTKYLSATVYSWPARPGSSPPPTLPMYWAATPQHNCPIIFALYREMYSSEVSWLVPTSTRLQLSIISIHTRHQKWEVGESPCMTVHHCVGMSTSHVNWQQKFNPYLATYFVSTSIQYIDIHYD